MFTSAKGQPQKTNTTRKPQPARDNGAVTILTSGCHFTGKLYCRGASRIGGKIDGQIISEGLLIVEEEAVITAEIKADEAIIQGRVQGKLHATGRVELCASSLFEGDIQTPVLVVREGAQFNGHSTMTRPAQDAALPTPSGKTPRIIASNGKNLKDPKQPDVAVKSGDVAAMKAPEINVGST